MNDKTILDVVNKILDDKMMIARAMFEKAEVDRDPILMTKAEARIDQILEIRQQVNGIGAR